VNQLYCRQLPGRHALYDLQVCHKQYEKAMEFEEHLSSYDHHHRKVGQQQWLADCWKLSSCLPLLNTAIHCDTVCTHLSAGRKKPASDESHQAKTGLLTFCATPIPEAGRDAGNAERAHP
jgi:hypothetical protein